MECVVCGKTLEKYAVIGKNKEMKVAFCVEHKPDCSKCDSCDYLCIKCGNVKKINEFDSLGGVCDAK